MSAMLHAGVLSYGLACPTGLLSATALASMRAGYRPFVECEHVRDRSGEPVRAAMFERLPPETPRIQRALALARYALLEVLAPIVGGDVATIPGFLALPFGPGIVQSQIHGRLDAFAREVSGVGLELREDRSFAHGRAAVFEALQAALAAIASGECGLALVGGLDSLVDPLSLRTLADEDRLLSTQNRDGSIPGEGAAFVLLERGADKEIRIVNCAIGVEPHPRGRGGPCVALGLAQVFGELRRSFARRVDVVISGQTGESGYERAFSHAYLRNTELMPEPLRSLSVGALFGDAGAAAGALALVAGLAGPPGCSSALVHAESDDGLVGGCVVESRSARRRVAATIRAHQLLEDLEARHLDEAEFLLEQREAAFDSPHVSLDDLARAPERRLLGHVEALAVGGPIVAERTLLPSIRENAAPEQVAAATLAALAGGYEGVWAELRAAVEREDADDLRAGVTMALRMCDVDGIDARIIESLQTTQGPGTAMWLDVLAHRGVATGEWLVSMLGSADIRVVRAAARLARHTTAPAVLDSLASLGESPDPKLREAVLATALIRGLAGAREAVVHWALHAPAGRTPLTWLALLGDATVVPLLRDDACALGCSGWPAAVDRGIELLGDEHVGRLAGEAICAITGLSTSDPAFWRTPAVHDDEALPPLHDDLATSLGPDADDALPWPNPQAIAAWWASRRADFDPSTRYLDGRPMSEAVLLAALRTAPLRRRHVLALALAVRSGGAAWLDTRASAAHQQAQLSVWTAHVAAGSSLAEIPTIDA